MKYWLAVPAAAVILLLVLSLPRITPAPSQRPVHAVAQIDAMGEALREFREACGAYPTTADGLRSLVAGMPHPSCAAYPAEGFLTAVPNDPWGYPFVYSSDGQQYSLRSNGADGMPGGSDLAADIEASNAGSR